MFTHIVNADCPLLLFLLDISPHSVYVKVTSFLMLLAVGFGDITVLEVCTDSAYGMNFRVGWYNPTLSTTVNLTDRKWCKQYRLVSLVNDCTDWFAATRCSKHYCSARSKCAYNEIT